MDGINLKTLNLEGALGLLDTFPLCAEPGVKADTIILYSGNANPLSDHKKFIGKEVYLFSEEQTTNFKTATLRPAKLFTIAAIRTIRADPAVRVYNYLAMNPQQAAIYLSIGIDKLVTVNPADIKRIFCPVRDID